MALPPVTRRTLIGAAASGGALDNQGRIHRALGGRTPAEVDHDYRSTLTAQTTKS